MGTDLSEVSFSIIYTSAIEDDVSVTPIVGILTFDPGQTEAAVSVNVIDDDIPEENELLTLRLDSATGDAVIVESNNEATLLILPSDDPNGVFQWESTTATVEEGTTSVLM